jgi:hypothetical protein
MMFEFIQNLCICQKREVIDTKNDSSLHLQFNMILNYLRVVLSKMFLYRGKLHI